jgi:hypothetical protein
VVPVELGRKSNAEKFLMAATHISSTINTKVCIPASLQTSFFKAVYSLIRIFETVPLMSIRNYHQPHRHREK